MLRNNDKEINKLMEEVLENTLKKMKEEGLIDEALDEIDEKAMEKFEEASKEDFVINVSRKNGHNKLNVEGGRLTLLIGLAGIEKAILAKLDASEEMFEFIKDHVGVEID